MFEEVFNRVFRRKQYEFGKSFSEFSKSLTLIVDIDQLKDNVIAKSVKSQKKINTFFSQMIRLSSGLLWMKPISIFLKILKYFHILPRMNRQPFMKPVLTWFFRCWQWTVSSVLSAWDRYQTETNSAGITLN